MFSTWKRKTAKGPIIPITDHCTTTHLKMCSTHRETIWRVPKLLLMLFILIKYNLGDVEDWKKTCWISFCSFLHSHPECFWCWWCRCRCCWRRRVEFHFSSAAPQTQTGGHQPSETRLPQPTLTVGAIVIIIINIISIIITIIIIYIVIITIIMIIIIL